MDPIKRHQPALLLSTAALLLPLSVPPILLPPGSTVPPMAATLASAFFVFTAVTVVLGSLGLEKYKYWRNTNIGRIQIKEKYNYWRNTNKREIQILEKSVHRILRVLLLLLLRHVFLTANTDRRP